MLITSYTETKKKKKKAAGLEYLLFLWEAGQRKRVETHVKEINGNTE